MHSRRLIYSCLAIFVLAATLRLLYAAQVRGTALDRWHEWDQSDMATYLEQSRRIAEGDWLARDPYHPYHLWQTFAPEEKWIGWYPPHSFHQAPGYSYFLAALRLITPRFIETARLLQLLAGSLSAVLAFLIAARVGGWPAGILAGVIMAIYGPLIQQEHELLREGISIFLMLSATYLLLGSLAAPIRLRSSLASYALSGAAGLLFGLFTLFHETGQVALVAAVASHFLAGRGGRFRFSLVCLSIFLTGYLMALLPLLLRNGIVGAPILSLSSRSAIVFAMSNAADAPRGGSVWGVVGPGFVELMDQSKNLRFGVFEAVLRSYNRDAGRLLANILVKFRAISAVYEAPDNTAYDFFRTRAAILGWLPDFGIIYGPALGGIAFALGPLLIGSRADRRRWLPAIKTAAFSGPSPNERKEQFATLDLVVPFAICLLMALSLVHSIGRLRLIVLPYLIIVGAVSVMAMIRSKDMGGAIRRSSIFGLLVCMIAVAFQVYAQWKVVPMELPRPRDFIVAAVLEEEAGELDQAAEDYHSALKKGLTGAAVYLSLSRVLWNQGRYLEAIHFLQEGARRHAGREEDSRRLRGTLAWYLATCPDPQLRDGPQAARLARQLLDDGTGREDPVLLNTLAAAYAASGEFESAMTTARRAFEEAEKIGDSVLKDLIREAMQRYDRGEAIESF